MRLWAVAAWLAVWHVAAVAIGQPIILPTPLDACARLVALAATPSFWCSAGLSCCRIAAGFGLGLALGCALAGFAARWRRVEELLAPLMTAVKAVPVASFVILALFWFSSCGLSTCIALLVALPVVYTNVLRGLRACDPRLDEMARLFCVGPARRARYIVTPQVAPYLEAACSLAAGLCWKAGVAAELIGVPAGTIGAGLYQAKIYLETADVLAWTAAVVALSVLCERLLLAGVRAGRRLCLRMPDRPLRVAGPGHAAVGRASATPAPAPSIAARGLTKAFGPRTVLNGVDLTIDPGAAVCVMAPSGSGKTTLARVLLGLEEPDGGTVAGLEGAACVAAFQEPRLVGPLSAEANVRLVAPRVAPDEVRAAFARLGIGGCADQPADELSGGQARRVALARALLAPAGFVVLDEAFVSLDEDARARSLAWARGRLEGKTALVVTHDEAVARGLGAAVVRPAGLGAPDDGSVEPEGDAVVLEIP